MKLFVEERSLQCITICNAFLFANEFKPEEIKEKCQSMADRRQQLQILLLSMTMLLAQIMRRISCSH